MGTRERLALLVRGSRLPLLAIMKSLSRSNSRYGKRVSVMPAFVSNGDSGQPAVMLTSQCYEKYPTHVDKLPCTHWLRPVALT
jgi:hypothetical protein